MSYVDAAKDTTSGVNFIEAQHKRFEELVTQAEVVAIVGVQVRPHDAHIWEPLGKTDAEVVYCSGRSASPTFKKWAKNSRTGKSNQDLSAYFDQGFEEICSAVGL